MTIQDLLLFFLLIFNLIYLKNNLNIHQIQVLSNKYHFRLPAGKLGTRTAAIAPSSAADGKIILAELRYFPVAAPPSRTGVLPEATGTSGIIQIVCPTDSEAVEVVPRRSGLRFSFTNL